MALLQAMEDACGDKEVASVQGWKRHAEILPLIFGKRKTYLVMWTKYCGQTRPGEEMKPNIELVTVHFERSF